MDFPLTENNRALLLPIYIGEEQCPASHKFGPFVRSDYLMHYVFSGRGVFENERGRKEVNGGEYFFIRPGELTVYQADEDEPWHYMWIHFKAYGNHARIDSIPDTGSVTDAPFRELSMAMQSGFSDCRGAKEEYVSSVLYRVIGDILSSHPARSHYVRRAESYINTAYMQDITVENIAKMLSLDRRYLSRIFKAKNGVSIKEYITARRLEGAARLLKAGYCVSEAASMCGYGDTANFSKSFKRRFGVPPSKY